MQLENGRYRAKAREWGFGETGTGKPQIGVVFDFLDGAGSITWYGFFTEGSLPHTIKALRACGWSGVDLAELDNGGGALDANEVVIVIENEEYPQGSGQWSPKVKWVNPAGGVSMKNAIQGAGLKSFAAEMRAKILAVDPNAARAAAQQQRPPASKPAPRGEAERLVQQHLGGERVEDDGIPF